MISDFVAPEHCGRSNQDKEARTLGKCRWVLVFAALFFMLGPSAAFVEGQTSYLQSIGVPSFSTAIPIENGHINVANGDLHLEIPIGSTFPQRGGGQFKAALTYDSAIWNTSYSHTWAPFNINPSLGGWQFMTSGFPGSVSFTSTALRCVEYDPALITEWDYNNFAWTAPDGTTHSFGILITKGYDPRPGLCDPGTTIASGDAFATDGSGYHMFATYCDSCNNPSATVYAPDGTLVSTYRSPDTNIPRDTNGNYFTQDSSGNAIDTLGRTPVTTTQAGNYFYTTSGTINYDVLDSQGNTQRYSFVTQTINVNTNFGQSGLTEYSGTITVIQEIDLPDGTKYQFSYDSGTSSGHYGLLTSMTLPSGAQISYTYANFSDVYTSVYRWISSRTTSGTGITGGTWYYTPQVNGTCPGYGVNCQQQTTVTTPSGDATVYVFNLNGGPWATQVQHYSGSASAGTLLATTNQSFDYSNSCPANVICNMPGAAYVTKLTETTTLPIPGGTNLNQSKRLTWDSSHNGNVTKVEEWNFYTGSSLPATVDRTTNIAYLTGTDYSSRNIVNRPTNITITNASGATISQTLNSYDGSSLTTAAGKSHHDDTNYGTGMNYRGNVTQVQRLVSGTTYLSTSMTYDMLGNVLTAKDSNNNQTSYDYTDNMYDDPGDTSTPTATTHLSGVTTNAYLKTITYPTVNGVTLTSTFGNYWGSGKVALTKDANANFSYSHFNEPLDRPTATLLPNNEWTRATYNSTDTQLDTYTGTTSSSASTSCSVCRHDRTVLDVLGRATSSLLVNDPDGQTTVATTYDSSGRVATASTPYRNTSDPTYGLETPGYDGLGRATQVQHQDGDYAYTFYGAAVGSSGGATSQSCSSSTYGLGYPVLVKDEVGNKRQTWTNGFGKVIETDEPNASGTLNVSTCYTYDANGNLTQVSSPSSQTRSYAYDLLSRVTQTATPESGATNFYYTTSGGALCSGDPGAVCRRTDARSITATYSYDALNRVIQISYNDSSPTTPTVKYGYDAVALSACTTAPPSLTITNGLGQRTAMCDGSGGTTWSYDPVGGKLAEKRTISGQTKTINYAYNLDGSIYTIQYPGNRTVTYTEGNAQRMTVVQDNPDNTTYATSATYAPQGALASVQNGANAVSTLFYNNRLETCRISVKNSGTAPATCASSTTGNVLDLSYSYAQSSHNNGNIATQTNNVTGASGRTQNYTYDTLNRLLTAQAAANSGVDCWGQSFGNNATPPTLAADALNNLLNINATKCSSPSLSVSGSTSTNQFTSTGYSYDSAGNNTADSLYTYTYDAENRIRSASVSGATYCYTYDGDGLRVMKAHGSNCSSVTVDMLYWRSVSGDTIAETDGGGSTTNASYHEYIFFAGQRIAQSNPSSSSVYFYFADHLGSTRVVTNASGSPCYEADFLPYGTENTPSGFSNTCSTNYKFTGYERDGETGLDYAFARYYNQRMGRFMSGDPLAGDGNDPQTLNRYADVRTNPVNLVDPSGMLPTFDDEVFWFLGRGNLGDLGRGRGFNSGFVDTMRTPWGCSSGFGNTALCEFHDDFGSYLDVVQTAVNIARPQELPPLPTNLGPKPPDALCQVSARVLQGNPTTIGKQGAFPGVQVAAGSAAAIPSQFGLNKDDFQPYISRIRGYSGDNMLFNGITDVIGGRSPIPGVPVRDALQRLNPGKMIFELPSASKDMGTLNVVLSLPAPLDCPKP